MPLPLGSNRDWAVGVLVTWVGVIGLGWVVLQWRQEPPAPRNPAWHPALGMALLLGCSQAWVAVQWLGGLTADVGATFQYLMLGLSYSLLFVLVVALFRTRRRLTLLLAVIVASGTLQAFYGAFMTLSGFEWLVVERKTSYLGDATGTFVNRNHLAGYLEITLACGIGLLLALRDGRPFD